jgi:predicted cupin superfamily sugar epimerase
MPTAEEIIKKLGLQPHPSEGGFFREIYRSDEKVLKDHLPERYNSDRQLSTSIYYMLTPDSFSSMHRLKTDEIYHFYLGDSVTMLLLFPSGENRIITLGCDIMSGQELQVMVPRDTWQGSFLNEGGDYALMGTTVAPGFDYDDFEAGNREKLIEAFPEQKELIEKLTRS